MFQSLTIQLLKDIWVVSSFLLLQLKLLWTLIHMFMCKHEFSFDFDKCPSAIAGSYGKCMFRFTRNCYIIFWKSYTILHPQQQYMRSPVSPCCHQHLELLFFFIFYFSYSNRYIVITHCGEARVLYIMFLLINYRLLHFSQHSPL